MIPLRLTHPPLLSLPSPRAKTTALLLCLLTLFTGALVLLPPASQSAPALAETEAEVVKIVDRYARESDPRQDPPVIIENGIEMKSSHVHGVRIGDERYYYRFLHHGFNYDPVSRGNAKDYAVVAVLNSGTQWEMEIYRLLKGYTLAGPPASKPAHEAD